MTEGTHSSGRGRTVWPSLVALFGTIAVVVGLLWLFGDDAGSDDGGSTDDPPAADAGDDATEDPGPDDEGESDGSDDGGESDEDAGTDEDTDSGDDEEPTGDPVTAPPELRTPVGILNSTSVAGLAAGAQGRLEAGGWTVPGVDDYGTPFTESTIYYPSDDLLASAEALRAQFPELSVVEPTIQGLAQDRLVVILGEDYAAEFGEAESG